MAIHAGIKQPLLLCKTMTYNNSPDADLQNDIYVISLWYRPSGGGPHRRRLS